MSGTTTSVKVACRVRPMNEKEILNESSSCISLIPGTSQLVITSNATTPPQQKSFTFDYCYDSQVQQETVYQGCIHPLLEKFLEGFNATILAYGQTGSGKTYSMGIGLNLSSQNDKVVGIVPRAVEELFERLNTTVDLNPRAFKYEVTCSFLELYNEDLKDLLDPKPKTDGADKTSGGGGGVSGTGEGKGPGSAGGPSIREDPSGKIVWLGVREDPVRNFDELLDCLQRGSLNRTVAATDMNATSSRSHAIFSVSLKQQKWRDTSIEGDEPLPPPPPSKSNKAPANPTASGYWESTTSKFHFVDLAGSERLKRTNAEGDRKKEGISINQGLSSLGNVISALGDENRKVSHVPYRDSRLTRMLQDSLGDLNYAETLNTLNYANRARNIKNKVSINQEISGVNAALLQEKERELRYLRSLVAQLQQENAMLRGSRNDSAGGDALFTMPSDTDSMQDNDSEEDGKPKTTSQKLASLNKKIQEQQMVITNLQMELADAAEKLAVFGARGTDMDNVEGEEREEKGEGDIGPEKRQLVKIISYMKDGQLEHEKSSESIESVKKHRKKPKAQRKQSTSGMSDEEMLIQRIEEDIAEREALMARIQKRNAEYSVVNEVNEERLEAVQVKLANVLKERDMALNKARSKNSEQLATIKAKYDAQRKELEQEVVEVEKLLYNNSRMQNFYRAQNGALSMNLIMTVEALKKERAWILKGLHKSNPQASNGACSLM